MFSGEHATVEKFQKTSTYRRLFGPGEAKYVVGREIFKSLMDELGFIESRPTPVSAEQMDGIIKDIESKYGAATVLYRGISEDGDRARFNQFIGGPQFLGEGIGGSGSYASVEPRVAQGYAHSDGSVARVVIKPSAKVVDMGDIDRQMSRTAPPLFEKMRKISWDAYNSGNETRGNRLDSLRRLMQGKYTGAYSSLRNDTSGWALVMGADILMMSENTYIILNREALWVQDTPFK